MRGKCLLEMTARCASWQKTSSNITMISMDVRYYLTSMEIIVKLGVHRGRNEYVFTRSWKISVRVHFAEKNTF